MATYSNQHWLLSHVRNSFISTDDTGMCETVMASDDLPKHFMRKFQDATPTNSHYSNNAHNELQLQQQQQQRRKANCNSKNTQRLSLDLPLQEVDFVCYPGLDQSDDEDMDQSTQSYDIQMYPEVGAHRFRSNTAQKLEKMDIARRKAARTKCVNYDEEILEPERIDLFVRKNLVQRQTLQVKHVVNAVGDDDDDDYVDAPGKTDFIRSRLSMQLANSPKQTQNKFMEYARFDGTSQTGMQTKRINVFLSMLPEKERNYPIKICVVASAKILEVIGFVCYKATIQFPEIPLKSIRHYALYMTEDNDDMEDFPPLDNREPCSKFGFSHLTLAERRPLAPVTRIDYHPQNVTSKSLTSEEDKARLAGAAVRALQGIDLNGNDESNNELTTGAISAAAATIATVADDSSINYVDRMDIHNDMLEAPIYRSYRLHIIDKRFFKTEVTLGISGERIEIDQHKNVKFWTKQKAVTYPIDSIAFCEIVERRNQKAILRIWLKSSSSSSTASAAAAAFAANNSANIDIIKSSTLSVGGAGSNVVTPHSPTSPGHYPSMSSPFAMFAGATSGSGQSHLRFKHYDFEANLHMADHILHKLNCILDVCSSELRRDFLQMRERKSERAKKHLKMF